MSLWAKYLKEREGCDTLENEFGFITYKIEPDSHCYIKDFFILPEHRGKGHAKALWSNLQMLAAKYGCQKFIAQVDIHTGHASKSLAIFLGKGFVPVSTESPRYEVIHLAKEVVWVE